MKKLLAALILGLMAGSALRADLPFREHRYDAMRVLPSGPSNVVFVGNSITNMHPWCEAFGSARVQNRGVSGAVSSEMLANIGYVLQGQPDKVVILMGTNDLALLGPSAPDSVVANLTAALDMARTVAPRTKVIVQGILPTTRKYASLIPETNRRLDSICAARGLQFLDLSEVLAPVAAPDSAFTLDGLHVAAQGYARWCRALEPYVGLKSVYPDNGTNIFGSLPGSWGMRASYFGMLPVESTDILFIGDETVHSGEWQELLSNPNVKNRGTGWGLRGGTMDMIAKELAGIFTGNGNKRAPAQVWLHAGAIDLVDAFKDNADDTAAASSLENRRKLDALAARYMKLVMEIQRLAPGVPVRIVGLLPTQNAQLNVAAVVPFNEQLRALAGQLPGVGYIDLYDSFAAGDLPLAPFFMGDYLNGEGYLRMAAILKTAL